MILIYSPFFDKKQIDNQIHLLKDRFSVFFINDDDIISSTESNDKLLRDIILNHKISLFYTHSIKEMIFTSTEISELITFLLNNGNDGKGGHFHSESDHLYFTKDNIDDVYSTVSELFR